MPGERPTLRRLLDLRVLLAVALFVAAVLLLVLRRDYREFRDGYDRFAENLTVPARGLWFPVVRADAMNGETVCIGGGPAPQVMLFLDPACSSCADGIRALASFGAGLEGEGKPDVMPLVAMLRGGASPGTLAAASRCEVDGATILAHSDPEVSP